MSRFGLVGPSYQSQSVNADAQLCMNWFPEIIESGSGKSAMALYPAPGLSQFATIAGSNDPVRGEIFANNSRFFNIIGTALIEYDVAGNILGTYTGIPNDGQPVSIVASNKQVLLTSNGIGFVFTLATNTLSQVTPAMQIGPWAKVDYSDGFFIALLKDSDIFQISNLLDAATWDVTQATQVSLFPENVVSMLVDHREVWMWGPKSSVVYADYGFFPFPYSPIPGAFLEQGCGALSSPVKLDNSVFWIGADERGAGIAWRAQGYSPLRVSNHAVEYAWQNFPTIADAICYGYQDSGHSFYVCNFPSANKTWVYDVATNMWHERGFWNSTSGTFNSHKAFYHAFAFGKHLVGDHTGPKTYEMATKYLDDAGSAIRRVRRAPHISSEQEWIFHHQLQVDFETGLGLATGQGSDPQAMLRWSDDGGHTWSNQYLASAGPMGQYKARVIWRRLGRSRDRVYELSVSDPIQWRIVDAYLQASPGYVPQERMTTQLRKSA